MSALLLQSQGRRMLTKSSMVDFISILFSGAPASYGQAETQPIIDSWPSEIVVSLMYS